MLSNITEPNYIEDIIAGKVFIKDQCLFDGCIMLLMDSKYTSQAISEALVEETKNNPESVFSKNFTFSICSNYTTPQNIPYITVQTKVKTDVIKILINLLKLARDEYQQKISKGSSQEIQSLPAQPNLQFVPPQKSTSTLNPKTPTKNDDITAPINADENQFSGAELLVSFSNQTSVTPKQNLNPNPLPPSPSFAAQLMVST